MMNDNHEDELTGFLFSTLYLIRDAENNGFLQTSLDLVKSLQSFLDDCAKVGKCTKEFEQIITLCIASMNLYENELSFLIEEIEKKGDLKADRMRAK